MPYITREDGVHFVIPSYRDVLVVKQKAQLKKEVLFLSQSYGEYITLQKKGPMQYEVAFSPDTGYLLGESIWHHFKKPQDLIYCEAIPNTTEAILVIVKAGSVYLDGSFSVDNIAEELVIFLTQRNNFEIYTYGDVPISQLPEEGKFSFESSSVKSFTMLDAPVFPTLPLLKTYQLQLVDPVLKSHGIGVFPIKQLLLTLVTMALLWMGYSYMTTEKTQVIVQTTMGINPFQSYLNELNSPAPEDVMNRFVKYLNVLIAIPGWLPKEINYADGKLSASVLSRGGNTQQLIQWARQYNLQVQIKTTGILLETDINLLKRPQATQIFPLKDVLGSLVDRLAVIHPGNNIKMGEFVERSSFTQVEFAIVVSNVPPMIFSLVGDLFKGLPFILHSITVKVDDRNNLLSGSINMEAVGS